MQPDTCVVASQTNSCTDLAEGLMTGPDFKPQFIGYGAAFVPIDNNIVIDLRDQTGRVDADVAVPVEAGNILARHPLLLVAETMCHALNVGVEPDKLIEMATNIAEFSRRAPFSYADNLEPLGLWIDRYPSVRYVMASMEDPEQLLVVRPGISCAVMDRRSFTDMCKDD